MPGALLLSCGLSLAAAGAPEPEPDRHRAAHASLTRPGESGGTVGYDLGVSTGGRRLQLDLDLARQMLSRSTPLHGFGDLDWRARRTARVATGVVVEGEHGDRHRLMVRVDRQSWMAFGHTSGTFDWNQEVTQSFGTVGLYGWTSAPDRPLQSALHIGGGVRRSLALASAWDGTLFDRSPRTVDQSPTEGGILAQASATPDRDRSLDLDFGRHSARRDRGLTLTTGARVDVPLWSGVVDGRVQTTLDVDQLETSGFSWGTGTIAHHRHWTALSSQTRLAARFVKGPRRVVPTLFLDINALRVLESPEAGGTASMVGFGITSGGA